MDFQLRWIFDEGRGKRLTSGAGDCREVGNQQVATIARGENAENLPISVVEAMAKRSRTSFWGGAPYGSASAFC